ncbi:hypothetical protein [Lichenifustis flavocetrariae]|uniref:Uncharacterized protein n=1 Tax=Lichenifustis flavocetrariae TaxID=2949735 RepID=A0AA42CLP1_9HYPH|nr:hypothetical protein [Lichenifustis flavocetrariae]MCW6507577.1 hypothetical protein [Lichenifustis flavocetrariae]
MALPLDADERHGKSDGDVARVKFVLLEWGGKPLYRKELRYCIRSLLAECPDAAGNIVIYTDCPATYERDSPVVEVIDISADMPGFTRQGSYHFRAKVCVLIDALKRYNAPSVLLDTDSFIKPGFDAALRSALSRGAVMNYLTGRNPFPSLSDFAVELPHAGLYRYQADDAPLYNSGLIAVGPAHRPALEDALVLMDALQPLTADLRHDQEQFAVGEGLRMHGIEVGENRTEFRHYCSYWPKQYMHWRFSFLPELETAALVAARPHLALNKAIARLYKAFALMRLVPHAPRPHRKRGRRQTG